MLCFWNGSQPHTVWCWLPLVMFSHKSLSLCFLMVASHSFLFLSPGSGRPRGIFNNGSHCPGNFLCHIHPCLHWVCVQEAASCVLDGDLDMSGCHGLPVHVLWRHRVCLGPGKDLAYVCGFHLCALIQALLGHVAFVLGSERHDWGRLKNMSVF